MRTLHVSPSSRPLRLALGVAVVAAAVVGATPLASAYDSCHGHFAFVGPEFECEGGSCNYHFVFGVPTGCYGTDHPQGA